mmetsp:Transcript_119235/g.380075  ORF Transcript_119235/g.380075 Transcript_119235/m.380075 type:complete len:240 (+) Transcript_119235:3353-4072(+)
MASRTVDHAAGPGARRPGPGGGGHAAAAGADARGGVVGGLVAWLAGLTNPPAAAPASLGPPPTAATAALAAGGLGPVGPDGPSGPLGGQRRGQGRRTSGEGPPGRVEQSLQHPRRRHASADVASLEEAGAERRQLNGTPNPPEFELRRASRGRAVIVHVAVPHVGVVVVVRAPVLRVGFVPRPFGAADTTDVVAAVGARGRHAAVRAELRSPTGLAALPLLASHASVPAADLALEADPG